MVGAALMGEVQTKKVVEYIVKYGGRVYDGVNKIVLNKLYIFLKTEY